jgi:hypothetical protein
LRIWGLALILLLLPGFGSVQAGNRWLPLPDDEIRRIAFGISLNAEGSTQSFSC